MTRSESDSAPVVRQPAGYRHLPAALAVVLPTIATPAWAGVPFVTDDPDTPDKGHFEINVAGQYTLNRNEQTGNIPSVEVNYGLTDHIELHILLPLAFEHPVGGASVSGLGDIELGVKYRFLDDDDEGWQPAIAFAPSILVPTGNANRDLGSGRTQAFLPIWLSKDIGKFTVFGGGGYQINPGAGKSQLVVHRRGRDVRNQPAMDRRRRGISHDGGYRRRNQQRRIQSRCHLQHRRQ